MANNKFSVVRSTCLPIQIDNCNTDLIIPARYLAYTTRDPKFYGDAFMHDLRYDAQNQPVASFVLNQPDYAEAPHEGVHEIIIGGKNWGSGSSREHAAWAIGGYGVLPVIVSPEMQAELFDTTTKNPQAIVTVDLPNQTVTNETTGRSEKFDINGYKKYCLENGLDDVDFLVAARDKVAAYETK